MSVRSPLAALALLLLWGGAARAETRLEVTGTPKKAEVALGQDVEVDVTVKNVGDEVELPELAFDARSVSFEVSVDGGVTAWDVRFNVSEPRSALEPDPLAPLPRARLKAGESWSKTFTIPAVAAGTWTVTTVYGGTTSPDVKTLSAVGDPTKLVRLKDAPKTVKVAPGPAGQTEIQARVTTTLGTLAFRFFPRDALGSALNFVRIAQSGFYDGKAFHRIDSGLGVVQGGAVNGDGSGHFGWSIPRELGKKHVPLAVGMARGGDPSSGGSQFYIVTSPAAGVLDRPDGYAIFAYVAKGKDVVDTLAAVKTRGGQGMAGQAPASTLKIESVKIQLAPRD